MASGLVWCALVGCVLLATNGAVERKAFAGQGELNPIGDRGRSDDGPNLHDYSVPVSGRVADAAIDPRAADPTMPLFHFVPWPFDWCALSCRSAAQTRVLHLPNLVPSATG